MNNLVSSQLYDNKNFYKAFVKDLSSARESVIIESPFITTKRMDNILPILSKLRNRGVRIVINTHDPEEHDPEFEYRATLAVYEMQKIGIIVLYTGKHHRSWLLLTVTFCGKEA